MPWRLFAPPYCFHIGTGCISHVAGEEEFFLHPRSDVLDQETHDSTLYQLTEDLNNLVTKASEKNTNKDETCLTLVNTSQALVLVWARCKGETNVKGEPLSEEGTLEFFGIEPGIALIKNYKHKQHGSHVHCLDAGRGCKAAVTKKGWFFVHPNLKAENKAMYDSTLHQLTEDINNLFGEANEKNTNKDRGLRLVMSSEGLIPIWTHLEKDFDDDTNLVELDQKGIDELFGVMLNR